MNLVEMLIIESLLKGMVVLAVNDDWKTALESKEAFNNYLTTYFSKHKELKGDYDTKSYYEYYTVRLDSRDGLIITFTSGITNPGITGGAAPLPYKSTEKMSIEEFRQLILHKRFADMHASLADVFDTVAGNGNPGKLDKP
ncbi:hypothetical protein FC85_GL000076 [Lentilactobacillus diolivorans DSM 14421]|uniref:Uncharacterized protein n=2 Tax=Lentilactobacillus diolivorans TaxID=179838 RepID=A0A0R1S959_9LACO|nr:hypothetical protein FC85_GL000076 [Lentilactobacillus diolivorans DSM 14421]